MNIWEAVIIAITSAALGVMLTVGINWRPKTPVSEPEPVDELRRETANAFVARHMAMARDERKLRIIKAVERSYEANR